MLVRFIYTHMHHWRVTVKANGEICGSAKGTFGSKVVARPAWHPSLNLEKPRFIGKSGAPGGTRTPDLLVRSQTLYPTELRARR